MLDDNEMRTSFPWGYGYGSVGGLSFYLAALIVLTIDQGGRFDWRLLFFAFVVGALALSLATNWIRTSVDNQAIAALRGIAEMVAAVALIAFSALSIDSYVENYPAAWVALTHSQTVAGFLQSMSVYPNWQITALSLLILLLVATTLARVYSNAYGRAKIE